MVCYRRKLQTNSRSKTATLVAAGDEDVDPFCLIFIINNNDYKYRYINKHRPRINAAPGSTPKKINAAAFKRGNTVATVLYLDISTRVSLRLMHSVILNYAVFSRVRQELHSSATPDPSIQVYALQ